MIDRVKAVYMATGLGCASAQGKTLNVPHGELLTLLVSVAADDGMSVDLEGALLSFRFLDHCGELLKKTDVTGTAANRSGSINLSFSPPAGIAPGTYHWDLWLTPAAGTASQVMPLSAFNILHSGR